MVYMAGSGMKQFPMDVLTCTDRLDANSMVSLKKSMNGMIKKNRKRVLLDLSKTQQVDLAGLGILIDRIKHLRAMNGDLKVFNISQQVREVFRMVGVSNLIEAFDSREAAIRSFAV